MKHFKSEERVLLLLIEALPGFNHKALREGIDLQTRQTHLTTNVPLEKHRKLIKLATDVIVPRTTRFALSGTSAKSLSLIRRYRGKSALRSANKPTHDGSLNGTGVQGV
jgi:hypothetical protein